MRYSEIPQVDQPKHRLREAGPSGLTTSELLAMALRINSVEAANALAALYHEVGGLARIPTSKISSIKGLGEGYASSILAMVELFGREIKVGLNDKPAVHSPADAAAIVQYEMAKLDQEELWVILLNTRNYVIKVVHLYKGSLNSSQVRIGEVFRDAIRENAAAVILVHNHPSGDPTPSPEDVNLTRAVVQSGKMLDIEVLDHIVIGQGRFVSLKEKGQGFS